MVLLATDPCNSEQREAEKGGMDMEMKAFERAGKGDRRAGCWVLGNIKEDRHVLAYPLKTIHKALLSELVP